MTLARQGGFTGPILNSYTCQSIQQFMVPAAEAAANVFTLVGAKDRGASLHARLFNNHLHAILYSLRCWHGIGMNLAAVLGIELELLESTQFKFMGPRPVAVQYSVCMSE